MTPQKKKLYIYAALCCASCGLLLVGLVRHNTIMFAAGFVLFPVLFVMCVAVESAIEQEIKREKRDRQKAKILAEEIVLAQREELAKAGVRGDEEHLQNVYAHGKLKRSSY